MEKSAVPEFGPGLGEEGEETGGGVGAVLVDVSDLGGAHPDDLFYVVVAAPRSPLETCRKW